jgi:mRNA interferase RelE/StbE
VSYSVAFTPQAERDLAGLERKLQVRVAATIAALADNPRPAGCRKMKGRDRNRYRVRVGDYRVVYAIEDSIVRVLVLEIGNRREIYR